MTAPLAGITVVSLEQAIAAPYASRQLADLGARVIKIERTDGDFARYYDSHVAGTSAFFVWANRGKESVVFDLKDPNDFNKFLELVGTADVYMQNLAPAAAERLGVSAAAMVERFPSLVACEVSGYGPGGPRSDDKAYDLAIQAEAGVFAVTGDEHMSKVGFSVADIAAGMFAYSGVLAALVRRERTGEGAVVEVSMLDAVAEWMSAPLLGATQGAGVIKRSGRRHHAIAPYGTFDSRDGHRLLIAVQNDREWVRFAHEILQRPELAADAGFSTSEARFVNVDTVETVVQQWCLTLDREDIEDELRSAGITVARVNTLDEVWHHPQLRSRDRFMKATTAQGDVEVLKPPADISGWETTAFHVPSLNEHP